VGRPTESGAVRAPARIDLSDVTQGVNGSCMRNSRVGALVGFRLARSRGIAGVCKNSIFIFGLSLLSALPLGAAPVAFSTGFEPPQDMVGPFGTTGFSTQEPNFGLFASRNGIDAAHEMTIENTLVKSGTQALRIDTSFAAGIQSGVSAKFENAEPFVTIGADVYFQSSSSQTDWQFAAGDDSAAGGFVGGFNISSDDGRFQIITGGFPQTGPIISRDTWYHFTLSFNLLSQTYDVLVNNSPVVSNKPFLATASQLRVFQFDSFAGGNDAGVLDNFSFTATPEPTVGVSLCSGLLVLLGKRRRAPAA
jgi:hypothetical protein